MKDKKQQVKPVVMDALGKGAFSADGKQPFLGTLDTSAMEGLARTNMSSLRPNSKGVFSGDPARLQHEIQDKAAATATASGVDVPDTESATEDKIPGTVQEQLEVLFGGENLSEEFMNKASVIFEAVVNERTTKIREQILRESATLLEQEVEKTVNELATRLDEYLNYVVEEWMKDNKLAVESGIRTEIAESFIGGLKNLFETHYIEVPENKHDVLEDLFAENQTLEESLNNQIQTNIDLKKEIVANQARSIFLETVSDMSQVDAERLASLAESVEFNSSEDFANKLTILKESYLKAAPVAAQEMDTITEQRDVSQASDGPMSVYVNAVSRQTKTY